MPRPGGAGWNGDLCIGGGGIRPPLRPSPPPPRQKSPPPRKKPPPPQAPYWPDHPSTPSHPRSPGRKPASPPPPDPGSGDFPFCSCSARKPDNSPYSLNYLNSSSVAPNSAGLYRARHCFRVDVGWCDSRKKCCDMGKQLGCGLAGPGQRPCQGPPGSGGCCTATRTRKAAFAVHRA